jgi:Skp family chaperone for outer membrane proteins
MSKLFSFLVLLSVVLLPLLPAQEGGSKPAPADAAAKRATPPALAVGVVDLGKAFDLYWRTIKERERLQRLAQSFDDKMKEIEQRADELKATIANLKEGRDRSQKMMEYELAMQLRRGQAQLFEDEMRAETARMQLAIHEDLEAAVRQLAKDRGLHVVLRIDVDDKTLDDKGQKQLVNRVRQYEMRQILYAADELDLTPALVKMLQVPLDAPKDGVPKDAVPPATQSSPPSKDGK